MAVHLAVTACLLCWGACAWSAETEPAIADTVTQLLSLDGAWRFRTDRGDVGESRGWFETAAEDVSWQTVRVPHCWNTDTEWDGYKGRAWYRRCFALPWDFADKRLLIRFESCFHTAKVWLNGTLLTTHEGANVPFAVDATESARVGEDNMLVVAVDSRPRKDTLPAVGNTFNAKAFDWWPWGGLTGPVAVRALPLIAVQRVQVRTDPDLIDSAIVDARVTLKNAAPEGFQGFVSVRILESDGALVAGPDQASSLRQPVNMEAGGTATKSFAYAIDHPALWHFDRPYLYSIEVRVEDEQRRTLHSTRARFGVRKIQVAKGRFYLNGEWIRFGGIVRRADMPGLGPIASGRLLGRDVDLIRRANAIVARPSQYPPSHALLDHCDRNGILVIADIPAWFLSDKQLRDKKLVGLAKRMLQEAISEAYNHPSVWAWCVGDGMALRSGAAKDYVRAMRDVVRSLDSDRFVTCGAHGQKFSRGTAIDVADFILWNQNIARWNPKSAPIGQALDALHASWPDKMIVASLSGFNDGGAKDERAMRQGIAAALKDIRPRPFVGGALFAYLSRYRTPIEWRTAYDRKGRCALMGLTTSERKPLAAYEFLRSELSPVRLTGLSHRIEGLSPKGRIATAVTWQLDSPVAASLPSYRVDGYELRWRVKSPDSSESAESEGLRGGRTLPSSKASYFDREPMSPLGGTIGWTWEATGPHSLDVSLVTPAGRTVSRIERTLRLGKSVALPSPVVLVDLAPQFNNDAISPEANRKAANFDAPKRSSGASYPASEMPDSGAIVCCAGKPAVPFLFPQKEEPKKNNVACKSQTISVQPGRYSILWVLGAAANGDQKDGLRLEYDDGEEKAALELSDWCGKPKFGERLALRSSFRHGWEGEEEAMACCMWAQSVKLDPKRTLRALVLPEQPAMHVFALTLVCAADAKTDTASSKDTEKP